jgi:hypothetical protein
MAQWLNAVIMRDVLNKPKREEFVSHMVQSRIDAATRGVPMELLMEEFVLRMAQQGSSVTTRGVTIKPSRVEFVLHMAQW